jgi:hypothetical protein
MRGIKTINQVRVRSIDGWREREGWSDEKDPNNWQKFTYKLETDEANGIGFSDERYSKIWPSSRTVWRRMKRKRRDNQMRGLRRIDPSSRTSWRRIKRMIRYEMFKQLSYILSGDGWRWDRMIRREIFKQLSVTKFTYSLETDEEDGMGWLDKRYSNNWLIHVLSWDIWRGCDGMIRWEVVKQLTKFTYELETDEEDGIGW